MEVTGEKTATLLTVDDYTILNVTSRVVDVHGGTTLTVCADLQMCTGLDTHGDTSPLLHGLTTEGRQRIPMTLVLGSTQLYAIRLKVILWS